jgi:hypothetical protein
MEGMQEGTLFDRDAAEAEEAASRPASTLGSSSADEDAGGSGRDMALAARAASRRLQAAPTEARPLLLLSTAPLHSPAQPLRQLALSYEHM